MHRAGRSRRTGTVLLFVVGLGLAGLATEGDAAAVAPLFDSPHFPIPIPAGDFAIADVNGDGKDDVVAIHPTNGTVGVYLNRGRRNFERVAEIAVGDSPEHLACVELDGNGRRDLVVSGAFGVKALLDDGGGRFRAGTTLAAGPAVFGTGDLDGDGLADVVVQQDWQSRVYVALPGGGFHAPAELSSGEGIPLIADFNGDGAADVAVVRTGDWTEQRVILYPGDGVGGFGVGQATFFSSEGNVTDAVVCHSTPDASPDIALRFNSYIDDVEILASQSDGSFVHGWPAGCSVGEIPEEVLTRSEPAAESAGPRLEPQHRPQGVTCISAADVDGDRRIELLSTYVYTRVSVYSRITFSDGRCVNVDQTASARVAIGDLDSDGHLDVIGGEAGGLVVHPGIDVSRYGRGYRSKISPWTDGGAVADFNGDGFPDVAWNRFHDNVLVSMGRPGGGFDTPDDQVFQEIFVHRHMVAADLNGDARPDLVTDRGVWLGNGDGSFQEAGGFPDEWSYLAVADLNADGRPDLVLSGPTTSAYLGRGDGTFEPSWTNSTDLGPCAIADADGDGRPDLFVGGSFARGRGDGTFEASTPTGAGSIAVVGDLSGDGIPDLVTGEGAVLRGNGSGNWSSWASFAAGQLGFREKPPIALADFDGDGDLDIAAADPTFSASVAIFLNDSRGGFTPGGSYGSGLWSNYLQRLVAIDATGDGKLDLIAISSGDPEGLPGAITTLVNVYNRPPDITAATARLQQVPTHGRAFAPVLLGGVVDPEGDAFTVEVTGVEQDEPVLGSGSGNTCPDAVIQNGRAAVRMERSGYGNGRVYEIRFVARDALGNESAGRAQVCVPHDHSRTKPCIDDGRRYSSLACRGEPMTETDDEVLPATAELRVLSAASSGVRFGVSMPGEGAGDVTVFDIAGRRLAKLEFACEGPCERDVVWERRGSAPGIYFARLRTAWGVTKRTVVLTGR